MLAKRSSKFLFWKRKESDQILRDAIIYEAIFSVWMALQGFIMNPTNIKKKLDEACQKGAVLDNAIYSLVERWMQRNAHVLVIDYYKD